VASEPAPAGGNFVRLFEATARRWPERPAIVWSGGTLTYAELEGRAGGLAQHLAAFGVRPGHAVAVSMPNGWPLAVALLGALKLGVTISPINPLLAAEERERILDDLDPVRVIETSGSHTADWPSVDAAAPAIVLYTSGSTGRPKGAMLSHAALGFANRSWAGPVMGLTPDDVVLAVLPLSHSFGLNGALLAPLLTGAAVAMLEHFSPEATLEALATHRVTVFPAVATMFRRVLDCPALATTDLSALRLAVSGAAPCPWEIAEDWRRRTGVRILRGYGSTELFRPISYLCDDPRDRPDAIGQAVPGVDLRVLDESGDEVGAGQVGELLIRTPAALDGYLGQPAETQAVMVNGWFRTGDLATVDGDGLVRIVGRKKELILRGGYSIVPGEVEAVLVSHPAVAEAAVVGLPHGELGEEVAAFVTLRAGARADAEELIHHCRERLASFKYPRRVTILDQLPRGSTGKVLKSRLAG
jgi:long-chain acyl-CoA synthetase